MMMEPLVVLLYVLVLFSCSLSLAVDMAGHREELRKEKHIQSIIIPRYHIY